jgi:hypothetical protein
MSCIKRAVTLAGSCLLALVLPTAAQAPAESPTAGSATTPSYVPDFGTAATSILTISAFDFHLIEGSDGLVNGTFFMRTCGTGPCSYAAGVSLPSGAVVTGFELEGCDGDPTGLIQGALLRLPSPVQPIQVISPPADSGLGATPGCALFPVSLSHTMDNLTGTYLANVNAGGTNNVGFTAVRIRYHLQVSAAPAAPTFNDVPTNHPQFQFIEALVSAGITAGCGSGNYCPDAGLTRGQMAVFLAKALGLQFPN